MLKLVIAFFILICAQSKAQLSANFSIHFETNEYNFTPSHRNYLDSLISHLPNIPEAYIIEVKGHTDNLGSLELNEKLSKNRATAVLEYLKNKKFKITDSSLLYFAYNKPFVQNSDENLWLNRRVEINFYARKLNMVKILGVKDFMPRKYKFIEDLGGTITYDSTKIVIPPNSFIHKNGSEVIGEIDINYKEYRNPTDFLLCGIPMSIRNGNSYSHFNSGGMFDISAFQNGEQLVLKNEIDKTINFTFPLNNFIDQKFYQFDTVKNIWNNNPQNITDAHSNMFPPFNGQSGINRNGNTDYDNFINCNNKEFCASVKYAVEKINYFISHDEPIRFDYPYKFLKNNFVDYKSPFYRLNIDTVKKTIEFIQTNNNNKLGDFSNYIWTINKNDFNKHVQQFVNGTSFVKVVYSGRNKFRLEIEKVVFSATGKPNNSNLSDAKLKRLNRKNYKAYLKYTYKLDEEEKILDKKLSEIVFTPENTYDKYNKDSLSCINYFYRAFLCLSTDKQVTNIGEFNLNKNIVAEKMKKFKLPFNCEDARRMLVVKDSIEKSIIAKRDSALNSRKETFAKFGINSTGIYNADQVKNIVNPVEIFANYKDINGKPLKIISIYISIKGLNGIINYNGYMNYGPYKFVYGNNDETMLIAVDEFENSYYCTPEEFSKFVNSKKNSVVNFLLKPLKNVSTVENLQKVVNR